jgi:thiol:disulfide interchange protein
MPKQKKPPLRKQPSTLLILTGVILLLIAIFTLKGGGDAPVSSAPSLEEQLDQALKNGRPTFVFLHSLECIPCKEMMEVVAQVYPEFQETVVLIDVDVYDPRNANLLQRERLQAIPTLVFYDAKGERQVMLGVLQPEQFRATLQTLVGD